MINKVITKEVNDKTVRLMLLNDKDESIGELVFTRNVFYNNDIISVGKEFKLIPIKPKHNFTLSEG
jgi:hypothetical protein